MSVFVVIVAFISSCSRDNKPTAYGNLRLNISSDNDVILVESKAQVGDDVKDNTEANTFEIGETYAINLKNLETGEEIDIDEFSPSRPETLKVPVGIYRVTASWGGKMPEAAWNKPIYSGSTDVEVKIGQTAEAKVVCSLANVKVSVEFEEGLDAYFDDYRVLVSNTKSSLVFGKQAGNLTDTAYFAVTGKLSWQIITQSRDGGSYSSNEVVCTDVGARQHYHLKFKLEDAGAASSSHGSFKIVVDDSVNEKVHDMVLDFRTDQLPEIIASFPLDGTAQFMKGDRKPKTMDFKAEKGIENIILSHNNNALSQAGLPNVVDLKNIDAATLLNEAGFEISTKEDTLTVLDITSFISSLDIEQYSFNLLLIDSTGRYDQRKVDFEIISSVEATALQAEPWAHFSILKAQIFTKEKPEGLKFQIRKLEEAEQSKWNEIQGEIKLSSTGEIATIEAENLMPETEYEFRTITSKDTETAPIQFTTQKDETIYNLSFDEWHKDGSCWYPNAEGKHIWDSANKGTSSFGTVPTIPEETDLAVSGEGKKAAKLETMLTFGILSAGNIYTGQFLGLSGMGAKLNWGIPFTSRPLALKGYYKYSPKEINKVCSDAKYKDKFAGMMGQKDVGYIRIMLADWNEPFYVLTNEYKYVQDDDPHIIAEGGLEAVDSDGEYVEFVIPLKYRSLDRLPKYVLISGAASRYGDYATGAVGSVMLLDEFSLVYDLDELTKEQRQAVAYSSESE